MLGVRVLSHSEGLHLLSYAGVRVLIDIHRIKECTFHVTMVLHHRALRFALQGTANHFELWENSSDPSDSQRPFYPPTLGCLCPDLIKGQAAIPV